jgi:hypothetical protein
VCAINPLCCDIAWGAAESDITDDITGDGTTDAQDIATMLSAWGTCPSRNVPAKGSAPHGSLPAPRLRAHANFTVDFPSGALATDIPCMASKGRSSGGGGGGGPGKATLVAMALLSVFLFLQALGMLPPSVTNDVTRWAALGLFGFGALAFGAAGSAVWCGLCAAMAVILNPIYPLPLGELMTGAKILGGAIAGAAVIRCW